MSDPLVTTTPYELLVRWDEQGALKGAHFQRRQQVSLDGAVIADRLLAPAPITAQDLPAHAAVGEALADALAALSRVKARVDELEATVAGEGI